jgi:hypothetical protein
MANNDIGDIGSQCGFLLIVQVTGKTFDINMWHGVLLIVGQSTYHTEKASVIK